MTSQLETQMVAVLVEALELASQLPVRHPDADAVQDADGAREGDAEDRRCRNDRSHRRRSRLPEDQVDRHVLGVVDAEDEQDDEEETDDDVDEDVHRSDLVNRRSSVSHFPWARARASITSRTAQQPPSASVENGTRARTSGWASAGAMASPARSRTGRSIRSSPM